MNLIVADVLLRKPERRDLEALYTQKNDPSVANLLGGFHVGYSREAIGQWIDDRALRDRDVVWVVAKQETDEALGHVGLYGIDHRIGEAEFGIMLGDAAARGRGLGRAITREVLKFGFRTLNLNRVSLSYLRTNAAARRLYTSMGFVEEGVLRQAQYKNGDRVDVVLMAILRSEFDAG